MEIDPNTVARFRGIKRFVVLMLENRSFDHCPNNQIVRLA